MAGREPSPGYILVVEDSPTLAQLFVEILEAAGYRTLIAANGQEALCYSRSAEPPALILLDLCLPVEDGCRFRTEQQEDPLLNRIPVVLVSGAGGLAGRATVQGAAGYLWKPVAIGHLLDTLNQLFPRFPEPAARP